jgi:hypothetical protein
LKFFSNSILIKKIKKRAAFNRIFDADIYGDELNRVQREELIGGKSISKNRRKMWSKSITFVKERDVTLLPEIRTT